MTPTPAPAPLPAFTWFELPVVIVHDGDSAWAMWDEVQRQLDAKTPEGRAMALANA